MGTFIVPIVKNWCFHPNQKLKNTPIQTGTTIPEFADKTESDKYRYDIPVWEFNGLSKSNVIVFWIPRTRELIGLTTNHEHGYWMGRDRSKVVYGRPDDAYRVTYLDIMWVEDLNEQGQNAPFTILWKKLLMLH